MVWTKFFLSHQKTKEKTTRRPSMSNVCAMSKHAKNPVSGLRGCYVPWSNKRGRQGDTLTGKQNSSTAVGKFWSGLPHSLLRSLIRSAKLRSPDCPISFQPMTAIWTVFSRSCWGWSGPQNSGVRTAFSRCCWGQSVDEFCQSQSVTLLLSFCNLCLLIAPEGLGSESRWKWWARGQDSSVKI